MSKLFRSELILRVLGKVCLLLLAFNIPLYAQIEQITPVYVAQWSPNGAELAVVVKNNLQIFDRNLSLNRSIELLEETFSLSWSPDGTRIIAGRQILDTQTLEVLITIDVPGTLGGWNKDGSQVYTLSANSTAIAIFDTSTGKLAQTVFDGDAILRGIEWSPDNTKFATSFNLKDLSLIEVDTGSVTSYNQNGSLGPIAWSPDSTKIASAVMLEVKKGTLGSIESASGAVIFELYVWDVSTGQIMSYITPLSEYPQILRWSPNGVEVAGGAANGGIYIWDTLKNELVDYFLSNGSILSMDYSPFGSRLAIGSNSYQLQYISPDRRVEPKNLPYVQSVPNIGLEVFVPIATVERFAEIAASCNAPASLTQVDSALQTDAAQTLLTQLDAVPEGAIPVGCEADLRAIAEAIQQSQ